jgi:hypothetical protein
VHRTAYAIVGFAVLLLLVLGTMYRASAGAATTGSQTDWRTASPACIPCPSGSYCYPQCNPPPPPPKVTISFYIWGGNGQISFNGTTYSDGGSTSITKGNVVRIYPVNIHTSFAFSQWVLNLSGAVSTSTVSNRTLSITGPGSVDLVLNQTTSRPWAGYVEKQNAGTATFTAASGSFQMPTTISAWNACAYHSGGCSVLEILGFWVGIGGATGAGIWQAGAYISYNATYSSLSFFYFCEYIDPSTGTESFYPSPVGSTVTGDSFTVSISIAPQGGNYTYRAYVADTSNSRLTPFWKNISQADLVDEHTVEWISEPPCSTGGFSGTGGSSCSTFALPPKLSSPATTFSSVSCTLGSGAVSRDIEGDVVMWWILDGFYDSTNLLHSASFYPQTLSTYATSFPITDQYVN